MNGTALRKPIARRVVGMVAGIVIIALALRFSSSPTWQRPISAPEHAAGGAAQHSLGTQNLCTNITLFFPAGILVRAQVHRQPSSTASASGTSSRRSMTPFTPTSATRRRWRCSWRGFDRTFSQKVLQYKPNN